MSKIDNKKIPKIGHAGTLDPFADGVLLVCTDKDTKKISELQLLPKNYLATFILGYESDTYDTEGNISKNYPQYIPSLPKINKIIRENFVGEISQLPPIFSAKKINGQPAYKLARLGKKINLKPKKVIIYNIGVNNYSYPYLSLSITCGSGTYIRSIAHDLGRITKTGAFCLSLTRDRIGEYTVAQSIRLPSELIKKFRSKYKKI